MNDCIKCGSCSVVVVSSGGYRIYCNNRSCNQIVDACSLLDAFRAWNKLNSLNDESDETE